MTLRVRSRGPVSELGITVQTTQPSNFGALVLVVGLLVILLLVVLMVGGPVAV